MRAAAFALLLSVPTGLRAECPAPDLNAQIGVDLAARTTGGTAAAFAWGVGAGWSLRRCQELPLRLEINLASDFHGPPWGSGTDGLEVARQRYDISALVGVNVSFTRGYSLRRQQVGLEAVMGPNLRITRASTTVRHETSATTEMRMLAQIAGGPFLDYDALRLALRANWAFPEGGVVGLLVVAGYQL